MLGALDPISLALLLGGLSLVPLAMVCLTAFLKISVVLLIARNALGVQQVPPTLALYGIAMAMTFYVMSPVFMDIRQSLQAFPPDTASAEKNIARIAQAAEPLREFIARQSSAEHVDWFLDTAMQTWPKAAASEATRRDWAILIPAFIVGQLKAAYEAAFAIYIPFVVVELAVSAVLLALGMQMVAPTAITIPLKLLLFIAVDGWTRILHALSLSFN